MTAPRQPDRPQRQSIQKGERRWSVRQFVAGAIFVSVLGAAGIYTLTWLTEPAPLSTEQTDSSPRDSTPDSAHETSEPEFRLHARQFVGSQACAECHSEIAETYAEHPMANTLAAVVDAAPVEIVEGEPAEFDAQGCRYRVQRVDDRMIHTEFMTDADGRMIYEQPVDVHYAVGSGVSARTYLIDRGGIMFESPITWYTDEQKWDLSPGYEDNPRQRFNRRITDDCIQCHSGQAAPIGDGTSGRFAEQPFPEPGIGCEKCHGPGKQHVDKFAATDWDDEDTLIVNPARLERRLQESVCHQCHMEGHRRILRRDRSFHDFRPGMATEEIWTVFVSPTPFESDGTARFTSHVEQMRSSACFLETDGGIRCTTCHDPHQSPRPEARAAFYRERCNSCHADHGCSLPVEERELPPALDSCIHCHMPMIGSSNAPHLSLSDHRVLRQPGNDLDLSQLSTRGEIWTIFDDADKRMPEWEVHRARALALADQAIDETNRPLMGQAITALETVAARDASDVDVLRRLGFMYGAAQNREQAIRAFEAAAQIKPHDEMSLKNLGLMALRTGSTDKGLRSYERYLKVNPWDGTMYGPYAALLASSGKLRAAVEAVERGLELDPTQRQLRDLAAQLYARVGDRQKSRQHREILRAISSRLDPWDQKRRDRNRKEMQESLPQEP